MKCFRWRTRTCSNTPDICVYIEREKFNDKIRVLDRSAMLLSPDYTNLVSSEDQSFGRHMFCVYNVSLSCPQNSVIIKSTARTNWPRQQDTSCHHEGGCENYVAFYDDRDSSIISREFYGQKNYTHSLDSDSFLAVMWTNTDRNDGVFEFSAKCNDNPFVSETSTGGGGSGNEEIRPASEDIDNWEHSCFKTSTILAHPLTPPDPPITFTLVVANHFVLNFLDIL